MSGQRKQSREGYARCPAEVPEGKRQINLNPNSAYLLCSEISPCVPFGHLVEMTMSISKNYLPYRHAMRATSPKQGEAYPHNTPNTGSEKQARQGERPTTLLPINPWRCEQYKEREENLTEFTLA